MLQLLRTFTPPIPLLFRLPQPRLVHHTQYGGVFKVTSVIGHVAPLYGHGVASNSWPSRANSRMAASFGDSGNGLPLGLAENEDARAILRCCLNWLPVAHPSPPVSATTATRAAWSVPMPSPHPRPTSPGFSATKSFQCTHPFGQWKPHSLTRGPVMNRVSAG